MTTVSGITHRKVQVRSNLERYGFMFMRLSGISLLVLAVGHMVIQHVLNSVHNLTLEFVALQWQSWGWKAYDMLLLAFAISHGVNGLRNVLGDYIHNDKTMKFITYFLAAFVVITIIWAGVAIASFDAGKVLGSN
ncbi:MAG: succinate dehydrogenase [Anaerolinea sp.]|nr:succinate dehydrogenase [Anaerolinea sp.]